MPTTRTPLKRRNRRRISPAAIEAFRAGDCVALHRELRLPPWMPSPLEADEGPSPWPGGMGAATWGEAQELRRELEGAARELAR